MTAELVDVFDNRAQGVRVISERMAAIVGRECLSIYTGDGGFIRPDNVAGREHKIASANWMATAELLARSHSNALLVDTGSTTTDVIRILDGRVHHDGYTDAQRLTTDELVYTGVVRTPLMALAIRVPFQGRSRGVAAELFATMGDVYVLTGDITAGTELAYTADGRGTSVTDCAQRLARMIGMDAQSADADEWVDLAQHFRRLQVARIRAAVERRIKDTGGRVATLVGAGVGRFLIPEIAASLRYDYCDFAELIKVRQSLLASATDCAPAVAVAVLLAVIQ